MIPAFEGRYSLEEDFNVCSYLSNHSGVHNSTVEICLMGGAH